MPQLSPSAARSLALEMFAVQMSGLNQQALVSLWTLEEIEGELNSPLSLQYRNEFGFVLYRREGDSAIQVMHLAVQAKGQGHFAMLWLGFERHVRELGKQQIFLEAKENSSGEKAYSACGFARQALRKNYYKDGANAWVMTKILGA